MLADTPIRKIHEFDRFVEQVKKERPTCKLSRAAKEIEDAIAFCLEGHATAGQPEDDHRGDEIARLNINVDELKISCDEYKKVVNKIFAALRYEMYQKVKKYWQENGDQILEELDKKSPGAKPQDEQSLSFLEELEDDDMVLISRDQILNIAENIDKNDIYQRALALHGFDATKICCGDI